MRGSALNMTDHQVRQFNHHLICHFSNATVKLIQFREREKERKKERKKELGFSGGEKIYSEGNRKERTENRVLSELSSEKRWENRREKSGKDA